MRSLIIPTYERFGIEFQPDDLPLTKLLRISMTTNACSQEHKPCIRKAQKMFDEWMESPDPINSNKYILQIHVLTKCTNMWICKQNHP